LPKGLLLGRPPDDGLPPRYAGLDDAAPAPRNAGRDGPEELEPPARKLGRLFEELELDLGFDPDEYEDRVDPGLLYVDIIYLYVFQK